MRLDASLTPQAATRELWETMQQVGPFGAGNPEPRLVLPAVKVVNHGIVGDGHVRCVFSGEGGGRLKAMAFASVLAGALPGARRVAGPVVFLGEGEKTSPCSYPHLSLARSCSPEMPRMQDHFFHDGCLGPSVSSVVWRNSRPFPAQPPFYSRKMPCLQGCGVVGVVTRSLR